MARKWLGSIATLVAGAGLVWGQAPQPASAPLPNAPQAVETGPTTDVKQTGDSVPPPRPSVAVPVYQNPTNGWDTPSKGSVFLAQPYVDHSQVWFQAEYLLWWIRPGSMPPVVGTAPSNLVSTGSLPSDSITSLFGSASNGLDYKAQSGLRLSAGYWFDNSQCWGIDGSFFQLEQKNLGATFASSGDPVIGPTFYDPTNNTRNLVLASLPNFSSGPFASQPRSAVIEANANNRLWSAEINVRRQVGAVFFADHLDVLVGFRTMQFSEGFDLATDSTSLPGNVAPSSLHVEDHLGVLNQFYGPQIGLASHTQVGRWSFDAIGKLAIGDNHEVDHIDGTTQLTSPTFNISSNTGILAEPTNIGRTTRERFDVLPEFTFNVGYQVIENVRFTLGYNFLYLNSVMRAGDLVDGVDARQVRSLAAFDSTAMATSPTVVQHDSRFWAQGLNVGVEVRY
jgi:Putative beta barrel porin-7 (BBP7)